MTSLRLSEALAEVGRILHDEGCGNASIDVYVREIEIRGEIYAPAIERIDEYLCNNKGHYRLTKRGTIRFLTTYRLTTEEGSDIA